MLYIICTFTENPRPTHHGPNRGKIKYKIDVKLQKISDITQSLPFTEFDFLQVYRQSFEKSELGRIRAQLPIKKLAKELACLNDKSSRGRKPLFSLEGEIALMFLKPYTGLSDDGLIEMLNGNIHMQIFCGVLIDPFNPIRDGKIVSAIRNRLATLIDIKKLQSILYESWKENIGDKDLCLTDATCYESYLRFPTDIKLLWECCEWLHDLLVAECKLLSERVPRNKYNDVAKARLSYAKQRKHSNSSTRKLKRRLLKLLSKLLYQWDRLRRIYSSCINLSAEQEKRLSSVRSVYRQQSDLFSGKEVKHRIVSIDRPYLRPIVRGKENKRVEFGAKVNNIQIGGISFIEHHSFEAFNEGIRLRQCIEYQESLTGIKVSRVGADSIYANNANRKMCSEKGITTCFVKKGPNPKDEAESLKASRRIIGNLRATVMEGSFGNQKQHYAVGRIKARNMFSETLLLFFGIHMANAAILAALQMATDMKKAV